MPKSRNRKDHKKKVQKRNELISLRKKQYLKMRDLHIKKLVEEQNKLGMFENIPKIESVSENMDIDIDNLDGPDI